MSRYSGIDLSVTEFAVLFCVTIALQFTHCTATDLYTSCPSPCRIRSDRQTTSLTLTTGVCEAGTRMRGASNMNIHYDVTGLLTAA